MELTFHLRPEHLFIYLSLKVQIAGDFLVAERSMSVAPTAAKNRLRHTILVSALSARLSGVTTYNIQHIACLPSLSFDLFHSPNSDVKTIPLRSNSNIILLCHWAVIPEVTCVNGYPETNLG